MSNPMFSEDDSERILADVGTSADFLQIPASEVKKRKLEREVRRLTSYDLHSVTLAEYYRTKKIPRGLRVSLRPTLFSDIPSYCDKFEQILNKCSMDIILLTIEQLQETTATIKSEISTIEQQLKDTLKTEDFANLKESLTTQIDTYRKELEQRKRKKYLRDTEDYLQNKVYRWRDTSFRGFYRPQQGGDYRSSSSGSDYPTSSYRGSRPNFRRRPRRGRADAGGEIIGEPTSSVMTRAQIHSILT
ncbi:uncharacterized protein LOC130302423 [Hyla sarda]|uniref:uncharacterized protein LOC130302423 n=1 Tax=Hyla sarda TaxID=327740 RepID=UPI0024C355DA|nr:uncharacterized protein LOC130302423 [Hyla sarda]